jgi:hypothetical protein
MGLPESTDPISIALDYCDTVNSNIRAFLKDKNNKMDFHIENAKHDFETFCTWIGAEVDTETAKEEFDVRYNAS